MLPWIAHKSSSGFTLTEMGVTALIVGILAAASGPSFYDLYLRSQTAQAFDETFGAIQEAQTQATKFGKTCTIAIDISNKTIEVDDPVNDRGCLINNRELPDTVSINSNRIVSPGNTVEISFNYEGAPGFTSPQTIVVYDNRAVNGTPLKQCVVISAGIGLMRVGNYDGDATAAPVASSCNTRT